MGNDALSSQQSTSQINNGRLKHLEILQQVIMRMANNSFLLEGWSVTLLSAILVLTVKEKVYVMGWIAIVPVVAFWVLDGFFLHQERLFRKLYDQYRIQPQDTATDFSMDTSDLVTEVDSWCQVMLSKTLIIFYGGLTTMIAIVLVLIHCRVF